jgi:hypothetical protein
MKGGPFRRWYGNQEYVLQLLRKGRALIQFLDEKNDSIRGPNHIFHRGVTWSDLTSGRFSARLSPGGFIFDVKGSSGFPKDIPLVLGLLNSSFAFYALNLMNPTVSFQVGDLSRLPVPDQSSRLLRELVDHAVALAMTESQENELTYDFVGPPNLFGGTETVAARQSELAKVEQRIDDEVFQLYGIKDDDRSAIAVELGDRNPQSADEEDESSVEQSQDPEDSDDCVTEALSIDLLARKWISYAVGIVLGRFQIDVEGGLGRGDFSADVSKRLRGISKAGGILVQDEGNSDDLAAMTIATLGIMLGDEAAREVVATGTGKEGESESILRKYLEAAFFKEHVRQYRKRPVYWLLQSPRKKFGVWVFHERLTDDSLYGIQREYVTPKIKLLSAQLADLRKARDAAQGRDRRAIEKQMEKPADVLADVEEFNKRLEAVIQRGYRPHIDDGVLLNMAPLWELVPSWQAEPKKAWQALERGDYDWAQQAMDYWPDRVKEKCKTNKSFAIAHGLE